MRRTLYRFSIGLDSSSAADPLRATAPILSDRREERAALALSIIARAHPLGFRAFRAEGYYNGAGEPSLIVDIVTNPSSATGEAMRTLARTLAAECAQECVALETSAVRFDLLAPLDSK